MAWVLTHELSIIRNGISITISVPAPGEEFNERVPSMNTAPDGGLALMVQGMTGCVQAASVSPTRVGTALSLVEVIFART